MKNLSLLTLSLLLVAAAPAAADDFGARFGGVGTAALEDTTPGDDIAGELQNITPAAGDPSPAADAEAEADAEAAVDVTTPPNSIETQAGTQTTLEGAAEPEPTAEEKTESNIIHYDHGMSPDAAEDPSYRLQDSTN